MRVAELSERTGVSVATIKYYLREGLLPRGERTGPNQAQYDERHERRLRLVRALVEVGGLSIAATRDLLAHIDQPDTSTAERLGLAMSTVTQVRSGAGEVDRQTARKVVAELAERRNWTVDPDDPALENLVEVVAAIAAMHGPARDALLGDMDRFAKAAEDVARGDLEVVGRLTDPDSVIETAVVGTIVGDTLLAALRRIAQVNEAVRIYRGG